MHAHEVYPHDMHAYDIDAHKIDTYEMHTHETHAYEMNAYEVHAHEVCPHEMHAHKVPRPVRYMPMRLLQTVVDWSICRDLSCKERVFALVAGSLLRAARAAVTISLMPRASMQKQEAVGDCAHPLILNFSK